MYDERGMERAVAAVGIGPTAIPAPGHLERDPGAMWTAVCEVARKVLAASGVAPSSIAAVGLTGYGNGLFLLDRQGQPVRNAILSSDQRAGDGFVRALARRRGRSPLDRIQLQCAVPGQDAAADRVARRE